MSFRTGAAHNGRRAMLQSSIYTGEVGVRDRAGGQLELAWFGPQPIFRAGVRGTLDGSPIRITALRVRPLRNDAVAGLQASSRRAIVATAELTA